MSDELRRKWDARHARAGDGPPEPARVLRDFGHLLPSRGDALDLACGLGGNALWLARRGFSTRAWDLSPVAIERLRAQPEQGRLTAEVRDVCAEPPPAASFDVIVVSHFLDRGLFPALCAALRPGGLLFYQTFTRERTSDSGPANPDFRLATNELLTLVAGLRLLVYREEGLAGDPELGLRDEAYCVAMQPGEAG